MYRVALALLLLTGCPEATWLGYIMGDGTFTIDCPGPAGETSQIVIKVPEGSKASALYPPECAMTEVVPEVWQ